MRVDKCIAAVSGVSDDGPYSDPYGVVVCVIEDGSMLTHQRILAALLPYLPQILEDAGIPDLPVQEGWYPC